MATRPSFAGGKLPFDSPGRNGVPLPGRTTDQIVSQLIWRVLGPLPDAVKPMLTWARGGTPVDLMSGVAWSTGQVAHRVGKIRAVGRTTPIPTAVAAELMALSATSERCLRVRRLFALPSPRGNSDAWLRNNTVTAVRVLSAAGPQPVGVLQEAVARTHTRRRTPVPSIHQLIKGLVLAGARLDPDTGLWEAPGGATPKAADASLVSVSKPGVVYSRRDLGALLEAAGYAPSAAGSARIDTHPLIRKVDRDRYTVLSPPRDAWGALAPVGR